ncbi:MAG: histidine kinase dimerization/phosphoacceptor domain -containing protein [Flavobacteriaceae bacterium]
MQRRTIDAERLRDKINLILSVNYISSALAVVLFFACLFFLNITRIIPYTFLIFGIANLVNTLVFRYHKILMITYNISSVMALICTFIITLYSGGINSPFIFTLALVVFAGYVTTRQYGQMYLNLIFFLVILIYSQSIPDFTFTENVVPPESRNLFSFLCVLFAVYLLGNVFGKNLLRTHHRLYKSKMALVEQMKERDILLKEIHHRVKNNLQTVSSLLSLQSRNIEDVKMKHLIKSSQNRVISMAMIHEMLYMRDNLSKIEYKSYVQELSEHLVRSIKGSDSKVVVNIDIDDIKLNMDTAIPLGLLINETITNALKYGFKDDSKGEIRIELKKGNNADYVLYIGDNGVGFSETITPNSTKSLGLKLIHNLAKQLKGSITRDYTKKGTYYILKFKEIGHQLHTVA